METTVTSRIPAGGTGCVEVMTPISEVLAQFGGKWTLSVVAHLGSGPKRFGELRRELAGISQKVLTTTLRDLERDGFVTRTVTPSIPPRVDYELTELGRELFEPLGTLGQWAIDNRARIQAARARHGGAS